jgi:hypothetical protein
VDLWHLRKQINREGRFFEPLQPEAEMEAEMEGKRGRSLVGYFETSTKFGYV